MENNIPLLKDIFGKTPTVQARRVPRPVENIYADNSNGTRAVKNSGLSYSVSEENERIAELEAEFCCGKDNNLPSECQEEYADKNVSSKLQYTAEEERSRITELNAECADISSTEYLEGYWEDEVSELYYTAEEECQRVTELAAEFEATENLTKDTEMYPSQKPRRENSEMQIQNTGETAYMYAWKVIDSELLCFLDDPNLSYTLARFNYKYWAVLNQEQLKDLVYNLISVQAKNEKDNIDNYCKNVCAYIKREMRKVYYSGKHFTEEDFRAISNHVVFQNCVYDAQTGEELPFNEKLPYYYAVNANYAEYDDDTPYYDKLKRDATDGDEESMDMIDVMIAYFMIPNRSAKCFFVMANARDSGKSLLGQFIAKMYDGPCTKYIDPKNMADKFSLSDVKEAVLLSCLEMSTDRLTESAVAQFKRITGEQQIRSEAKYKNADMPKIRFKLLLATNGGVVLPLGMEDPAFYRRLIVIPFVKSTPLDSLMNDLDKRLWEERDAILSKCIRKLKRYISKDGGIVFPESALSLSMKEQWMGGRCLDDEFIRQAFSYTGDTDDRVAIIDIESVYNYFIDTQKGTNGNVLVSDRKTLVAKILRTYVGADKKKARVNLLNNPYEKDSTNAIRRINWNRTFLLEIGFPVVGDE